MTVTLQKTNDSAFLRDIEEGLNAHNKDMTGSERIGVNFVLKNGETVLGGMKACHVGRHFFISWLFVASPLRGQGWGRQLMAEAEAEALKTNCTKIFVDTMSFQAPGFYERLGFKACARIPDFYEGHDRIFYQKIL